MFKDILIIIGVILIFAAGMITVIWGITFVSDVSEYKVYDCSLAEISPDFPIKVKEDCRKLRKSK